MNKVSKYFYIISFKEKYNIDQLENIILNRLILYYKILIKITSIKYKLFMI